VNIAVDPLLSVAEGHEIAVEVQHRMIHSLGYLSNESYMWTHSDRLGKHFTGSRNMNKTVYLHIHTESLRACLKIQPDLTIEIGLHI